MLKTCITITIITTTTNIQQLELWGDSQNLHHHHHYHHHHQHYQHQDHQQQPII